MKWVADFETTTAKRKEYDGTTHVWAVGLCEIGNPENTEIFTSIDEFFEWCEKRRTNDTVFLHNLRFDGNFIIQYLMKNGFQLAIRPQDKKDKTFTTFISDKSLWYEIEVFFKVKGTKVKKITFRDSLKLIPLSVREIAKAFHLEIRKGKIDYSAHDFLPVGSPITKEEEEYLIHDIRIVEHALNFFFENGFDKMTIGSCAMSDFKGMIGERRFDMYFPKPFYDEDVRKAYRGGFTYLNPRFEDKTVKNVLVYDVNSLYPSVMNGCRGEMLPIGTPIFFRGEYEYDKNYPLYVQKIRCSFELKKNKIPTVQIKGDYYYHSASNYITSSDDEEITMYMTNVDLELFKEQYETGEITYLSGWKFKAVPAHEIFGDFVEKWSNTKIESKEQGNWGMYLISKLFLNNLYGKFGTAIEVQTKRPVFENGKISFQKSEAEKKDGVYIGMACFITAYARAITIRAAQKIQDDYYAKKSKNQFIYADTDSLHIYSPKGEVPEGLEIHPTKLGAWDHEATATKGKFLRQKCYMEEHIITEKDYNEAMQDEDTIKELYEKRDGKFYFKKITVAGMPENCHRQVTFDNFKIGAIYQGKLTHKTVVGGVVLEDIDFTIKY